VAVLFWLAFVPFPTQSIMFLPTPGATYDVTRILFDPFGSLVALPKTALADGYSWLLQLAGPYWNECTSGEDLALPLVCGAIVLAVILDADRFRPTVAQRLIGLLVFSGTYGTVILVALASWTPMGDDRALGVHVRYFLPALPALAIALMPPAPHLHAHWARVARITIVVALAVSAAIVQIGFLGRYDW
jgi:hypothetical protein